MASVGDIVGRLTVQEKVGKAKNGAIIWKCSCACGGSIEVQSSSLNSSLTRSCGCLYNETRINCNKKHAMSHSREYNSWSGMKQRCYYKDHAYYNAYGGRGITVCATWLNSFEQFYKDMGQCPDGMSIERINCNLGYYKENCKWDTNSNQGYNKNIRPNNTSGRTGVYFHKRNQMWVASITLNYKVHHLGSFNTFEEAVFARSEAELNYYGRVKDE